MLHQDSLFPYRALRSASCFKFLIVVALALAPLCGHASNQTAGVPLGVNGDWDWVNLINGLGGWNPVGSAPAVPLDAAGWPTTDAGLAYDQRKNMPYRGPDALGIDEDIAGVYKLSFTGQATILPNTEAQVGGLLVQNQRYDAKTNRTTADLLLQPGHSLLQLQLVETRRLPTDLPGTGFTNMRLIRPGYSTNTQQTFTPGSLAVYHPPFASIRFLEVDGANNYQTFFGTDLVTARWADRVQVTDAYQAGLPSRNTNGKQSQGEAWEYMILLANATHHDMWINVPVSADDDYVSQLANLIRNGNQYTSGLDAGLNVYVEYSNEVWNFGFPQYVYNQNKSISEGITVDQRYMERTFQIARIFESTFGETNGMKRVRPVALWQTTQELTLFNATAWAEQHLGMKAADVLYGLGQASYYNASDISTVDATFATMRTGSDSVRRDLIGWQAAAAFYGLHNVSYESGPGSLGAGVGGYTIRDPRMIPSITHHFLDNWFAVGGDTVNYYGLRGAVSEFGDYLLVEDYEHFGTPTYQAALDVLRSPRPALTAGYVLPFAAGQTVSIDPSQRTPDIFSNEAPPQSGLTIQQGSPNIYLLRAAAAGTYTLQLFGHASDSSAEVNVLLDDTTIGTVSLGSGDSLSAQLPFTVSPGLHTLSLAAASTDTTVLPPVTGAIMLQLQSGGGTAVVPSAPTNLTARPGDSQVALSWATTTTAQIYYVARSTQSGGPFQRIAAANGNAYVDTTVTNGSTYYYVVSANSRAGRSAHSAQVSAFPAPASVPSSPSGVNITYGGGDPEPFYGGGIAILHWSPAQNAAGYNIYRAAEGGGFNLLNASPQSATQYTDLSISNGQTYSYQVTSVNFSGESAPSAQVTASPVEEVREPPVLNAQNRGGFIFLNWIPDPLTTVQYNTAFNVKRSNNPGGPYTTVVQTNAFNAYDFTALPGRTYYYIVTATNNAGESASSNGVESQANKPGALGVGSGSSDIPEE